MFFKINALHEINKNSNKTRSGHRDKRKSILLNAEMADDNIKKIHEWGYNNGEGNRNKVKKK